MTRRAAIIVLDGVGIGAAPDAAQYGDVGSDTLGNVSRAVGGMDLPNLAAAGLGNIAPLAGVEPTAAPTGAWGLMIPQSAGKDSTTGHWEIAGVHLEKPFPTYPNGFPESVVAEFARRTGRGVIGNVVGSGTAVIDQFGPEHQRTGSWILYTSADSVFQIAAHEGVVSLDELYRACESARHMLVPPNDVSRVIARPFEGAPGAYHRTKNRRDFSIAPPAETLLDALESAGIARAGVGKVDDLFAGRGILSTHTGSNAEGIAAIAEWLGAAPSGLLFANLVDFDQAFGHRNDVPGFYGALREFDAALPGLLALLREDDLLFITADHGNDPTTPSTDHARECVPLVVLGHRVRATALGRRSTFSDLGATIGEWFDIPFRGRGSSFCRSWSLARMAVDERQEAQPAVAGGGAGDDRTLTLLRERALAAMERAYAPYSNFRVGAALLSSDGSVTEGCNIENAAYPAGLCAERGAVAAAVARGNRSFETVLIATEAEEPTPPCGICRQVLVEFAPHLLVVSVTRSGRQARWTLDELLPKAFNPHSLDRR